MRAAVDMISAGTGFAPAAGGMTTYYEGLASALPGTGEVDEVIAFMPESVDHARIGSRPGLRVVDCRIDGGRARRVAFEHLRFPGLVAEEGADVLLSTHNVRPLRWRGPSVVVLQSMQYFFLPDRIGFGRRAYLRASVPRSLRSAHRVVAVSEAARLDAIELFSLDPDRVAAVHHGPSPWATEAAAAFEREGTPPAPSPMDDGVPYVLNVSSLYGLKNHGRLIEAFAAALNETGAPHRLAIAGRDADVTAAELAQVARDAGIGERVRMLGPYPQAHLPALVANADAVAYPSLYETFGHPVLEAFAFGRPLLTSDAGGSAEVAGSAALKADPRDVASIASQLTRLMSDPALRDELGLAGRRRLGDFSWESCAAGTAAVLEEAVAER